MSKNAKRKLKEYQEKQTQQDEAQHQANKTRLNELVKQAQVKGGCLDGIVHDLKSQEASAINNQGCLEQSQYIVTSCGEEEAIKLIEGVVS